MEFRSGGNLLRERGAADDGKVSFVELFFDLVFVFAITQLSHFLLHHFTPLGAVEMTLLMLAIWWVWIYSTWVMNWLDPATMPVRLLLYGMMLLGLFLSMAVPEAFDQRGLVFALALVAMQVGRCLFALWALAGRSDLRYRNFVRITAWLALSGLFWILGGLASGEARLAIWFLALGLDYAGPALAFWTPGLGRSTTASWDVHGGHIAERCGLFVIICLGEALLISGATFADLPWTGPGVSAFIVGFVTTVAMWWIYFRYGHERATHQIEHSDDPGRIARIAFTYAHIPIVAGVVLSAVAAEFLIAHPEGHAEPGVVAVMVGGPAVFLLGNLWFKTLSARVPPLSHLVGLVLLAAIPFLPVEMSPLRISATVAAVLVLVALWERLSLGTAVAGKA